MSDHLNESSELTPFRLTQDLVWVNGIYLLFCGLVLWDEPHLQLVRIVLGSSVVLILPGYCLAAWLFPAASSLSQLERGGLSVGFSVAWVPIFALLLDQIVGTLSLAVIISGYGFSMLAFSVAATIRRFQLGTDAYIPTWQPLRWWRGQSSSERGIYSLSAAMLFLAAAALAYTLLIPSAEQFTTEFYILGADNTAESYPRQATTTEPIAVTIGIANRERSAQTYRAEIFAVDIWQDRRERLHISEPILLAGDEEHEWRVNWTMPFVGDDQQVEIELFINDDPDPYRQLRLWLDVTE